MSLNHTLINAALRARGLALTVVTTGTTTLGASSLGYTRSAGSFVADGFAIGMEVLPSFGAQTPQYVTAVTAGLLSVNGGRVALSSGAGRSVRVSLPALRSFDNEAIDPLQGRWYVEGEYSPSTARLRTVTASRGYGEATGEYYWRLYGIAGVGDVPFTAMATALLALYPPGDAETLSDGAVLRIEDKPAPRSGSVRAGAPGFSVVTVTIPWRCEFTNPVLSS